MGERLRGNALDAADAATGDRTADAGHIHSTGVPKGAHHAAVDARGQAETEAGMANMRAPVEGTGVSTSHLFIRPIWSNYTLRQARLEPLAPRI